MTASPEGWSQVTLGEVAETQLGKMLSSKSKTGVGSRPYLRNKNVQWGRFDLHDVGEMDFTDAEFKKFALVDGDLLVCEGGEVGRAAIWKGGIEGCAFQKALHRVRVGEQVLSKYLFYLLRHYSYSDLFDRFVTGSTIRHLPQEDLRVLPVPLPPIAEQERIVAAIEEQFSRLDAAEDSLRRAEMNLRRLRESSMRIPYEKEWSWTTLGEIAEVVGGVTKNARQESLPGLVEVPYLRVANVQRGSLDLSEVTMIRVKPERAKALALQPGDVLLNEGGDRDKLGRGWVWNGEVPGCIHQNHVFRARLLPGLDPRFVSWHANTFGRSWFERRGSQTTNLASISRTNLRALPVPTPSAQKQKDIADEIDRRLSVVDALVVDLDVARSRLRRLRTILLREAFAGRLVRPQHESAIEEVGA